MESESALDVSEGASAILRFFQARRSGLNLYLYTRFAALACLTITF